jgi:hypothetical protein
MSPKASQKRTAHKRKKDIWHLYGLQALVPARFIHVVNDILKGRYTLIGTPQERKSPEDDKK